MRVASFLTVFLLVAAGLTWWRVAGSPERGAATRVAHDEAADTAPPSLVGSGAVGESEVEAEKGTEAPPSSARASDAGFARVAWSDARVKGRVTFADGRPAPAAQVWMTSAYRPLMRSAAEAGSSGFFRAATRTDPEGRYGFTEDRVRGRLRGTVFLARRDDDAAVLLDPDEQVSDDGVLPDLVLVSAIHPRIEVVDAYGDPVPDATGTLGVHHGGYGIPELLLADRSGDDGRLAFLALPDHPDLNLELALVHPRFPDLEQELDVDTFRRGEPLRVRLQAGRTVRGRLLDAAGEPARGMFLRVAAYDAEWKRQQMLDGVRPRLEEDGTFEAVGVPAVESRLLVFEMPTAQTGVLLSYLAPQVVDLPAGKDGDVVDLGTIHLAPRGIVSGTVVDAEGRPLEGVRVRASIPVNGIAWQVDGKTDAHGRFRLQELPAAALRLRAEVTSAAFGERHVVREGVRPGGPPIELRITGGSTLVLRFHPEGRPDEPLSVRRFHWSELAEDGETSLRGGGGGGGASVSIGSDGTMTRRELPGKPLRRIRLEPRAWRLRFTAVGYEPVDLGPLEIVADRDTVVDLELVPVAE